MKGKQKKLMRRKEQEREGSEVITKGKKVDVKKGKG